MHSHIPNNKNFLIPSNFPTRIGFLNCLLFLFFKALLSNLIGARLYSMVKSITLEGLSDEKIDHDYLKSLNSLEGLTEYKESVVEYIGGFVVRQVRKNIKCEVCLSSLISHTEGVNMKLVNAKDRGGLIRLSPDVKKICEVSEQCLQHVLKTKGLPRTSGNVVQALSSTVLKVVSENYPRCFEELNSHTMDCSILSNHLHEVIRSIAIRFIKIRLHHVAKLHTQHLEVFSYQLSFLFMNLEKSNRYVFRDIYVRNFFQVTDFF
jgi:hypothetical protein